MKNSMVIKIGTRRNEFHICPVCPMEYMGDGQAPCDETIPTYYSERQATDEGWRKTKHIRFCEPGKSFVWVCPDCWPRNAHQQGAQAPLTKKDENMEQLSPEWFEARKGMITGSRVGGILGLAPYQTREDVMRAMVREYHGAETEFKGNPATEYGTNNEPYAIADYELLEGSKIQEVGFLRHPGIEWLGASPDGVIDDETIIEIKCPYGLRNDKRPKFKSIKDLPHYYAQMQIEMMCAGADRCYFMQWTPVDYYIDTVRLDYHWIGVNLPKLEDFHKEYLKAIEKPLEYMQPKVKELTRDDIAREYAAAKEAVAEANCLLDEIKDRMIALAGDNKNVKISGIPVNKITRKGAVQYKKIPELDGVDLEQYRGKDSTYWKVG